MTGPGVPAESCNLDGPKRMGLSPKSAAIALLYPNPASQVLHITSEEEGPLQVTVIDAAGRVHLRTSLVERTIDVSVLPAGVYQVQVQGRNGTRCSAMVIQQ